ncbi:chorismate pyruvate-lyase [Marinobacterium nitratireducens]|uniref:Probable chorismate pyruvate-lyase n=1 Tax=Marinobacterium nitratireducens TaxID=518897 RepID=A0A917ZA85_9GAMM|nr:chorismate lyase [Marinobacterium nitratireducens]GGO77242.1 chorismate pyruvate-lyase [Marinobacterium nitratireducens]
MTPAQALIRNHFSTRWRALRRPSRLAAPAPWRNWLLDRGSLTQRLISASRGRFHVEVLRQGVYRPSRSEARALGLPPRRLALIREVQLCGAGEPWVYARSVFPVSTLSGAERRLTRVGNRSLGTLLFSDPTMRREPLQIGELQLRDGTRLWARRSVFRLGGKPLLVCEVFLPALEPVEYPLRRNSLG